LSLKLLWQLQELDRKVASLEAQQANPGRVGEFAERLENRTAHLERHQAELAELQRRQRADELDLKTQEALVKTLDGKLYGGSTTGSRELLALEADLLQAKQALPGLEDRILEGMEAVERLEQVSKDLDDLIGNGDFDSALRLAIFVANRSVPYTADLADLSKAEVLKLENWEVDVDCIIMNVAVALGEAAEDTKNLGIERTHKRQPTLMAVQEIKNLLTVRRETKPQIKDW